MKRERWKKNNSGVIYKMMHLLKDQQRSLYQMASVFLEKTINYQREEAVPGCQVS